MTLNRQVENMATKLKPHKDYTFADKICDKLLSGSTRIRNWAIEAVIGRYQYAFKPFISKRLCNCKALEADEVLDDFWMELMNGKAICNYHGRSGASLKSYLTRRLIWHINGAIRKCQNIRVKNQKTQDIIKTNHNNNDDGTTEPSPEHTLIAGEVTEIINQSLDELSKDRPLDASYIKMRLLEGMTYEEIASISSPPKTADAIKRQFTRPDTGSLARFKKMMVRVARKLGINKDDLMDLVSHFDVYQPD